MFFRKPIPSNTICRKEFSFSLRELGKKAREEEELQRKLIEEGHAIYKDYVKQAQDSLKEKRVTSVFPSLFSSIVYFNKKFGQSLKHPFTRKIGDILTHIFYSSVYSVINLKFILTDMTRYLTFV